LSRQIPLYNLKHWRGSSDTFVCDGDALLVFVLWSGAFGSPTVTYDGDPVAAIAANPSWSPSYKISIHLLAAPSSGANALTVSPPAGGLIAGVVAVSVGNYGGHRTASFDDNDSIGSTVAVSSIASAVDELLLGLCFAESPFDGVPSLTEGAGLRRLASRTETGDAWIMAIIEKVSGSASESVSFTHNGQVAGAGVLSITPDASVTLPEGRCNIDFFGGDHESLHIEWSYDGDDSPTSYELSFDDGETWTSIGLPSEFEHDITTGITPETLYRVKIRARNADGPGEWSDAASFTTPVAPVGAVIPVDHESAYSSGTSANLSITVSGVDTAVIVAVGARDEGYGEFSCTLNGTPMTVLGGDDNYPLHYKLCQATGLAPGTYTVAASVSDDAPGGIVILAIAVENWNANRTPSLLYSGGGSLGTHSGIAAQPGDLVFAACFRYGVSSDATSANLDILETAGSSDIRGTLGIMTADASPESVTWSGAGFGEFVYIALSLEPGDGGGVGGDPPEGTVDFDAAVGYNALALRSITYSGSDTSAPGFRFQYRLNGGAWSNAVAPYLINSQTPGSYVTVQMRAVNDHGPGEASPPKRYRLHYDWHRTGIRRWDSGWVGPSLPDGGGPAALWRKGDRDAGDD
jgi:hypothetical protein